MRFMADTSADLIELREARCGSVLSGVSVQSYGGDVASTVACIKASIGCPAKFSVAFPFSITIAIPSDIWHVFQVGRLEIHTVI